MQCDSAFVVVTAALTAQRGAVVAGVGWGGVGSLRGGQVHPLSPPTYFVWLEKADEALAECSKEVLSGR